MARRKSGAPTETTAGMEAPVSPKARLCLHLPTLLSSKRPPAPSPTTVVTHTPAAPAAAKGVQILGDQEICMLPSETGG